MNKKLIVGRRVHIPISKPLFIVLILIIEISILLLLYPELSLVKNEDAYIQKNKNIVQKSEETIEVSNIWNRDLEPTPFLAKQDNFSKKIENKIHPISDPLPSYIPPVGQPVVPSPQFKYVGRMLDGNKETIFFIGANGPFATKIGDVIDSEWRIEAISAVSINIIHISTNTSFKLDIK